MEITIMIVMNNNNDDDGNNDDNINNINNKYGSVSNGNCNRNSSSMLT